MGRILSLVLGLGVVAFVAWKVMGGGAPVGAAGTAEPGAPTERLQEAKGAARRLEDEQARRAAEALKAGEEQR